MTVLAIPWFTLGPWSIRLPGFDQQLTITSYEVSVILALIVGLVAAKTFATTHGRSVAATIELGFYLVLFSFPVSALLNGIFYEPAVFDYLLDHPSKVLQVRLGLSSYGGIVGCIIGAWVWKWRTGDSILRVGDSMAFAGPFGWAIARVGCFVSHDHPGRVSDFFLAVADFQTGTPPYEARHDLGLYEALVFIAIAPAFLFLARSRRLDGFYVAALPLLYTPCRFCLDFLRASSSEGGDIRYAGLTPGQYASVALFIVALFVLRRIHHAAAHSHVSKS